MKNAFEEGIQLFNARKFFEAHEALEVVWLKSAGDEKIFLHGLIQIAAAFHHQARGNVAGCRSLLEKGVEKLERSGGARLGISLARLRAQLEPWREFLSREEPRASDQSPPFPRL